MALDHLTMTQETLAINTRFGEEVRRVFEEHAPPGGRLSLQQARIRTRIDHDTLQRMKHGDVPRMDKVIDFARGFGEDVNWWLRLAGYAAVEPSPGDAIETLARRGRELEEEVDVAGFRGAERLSANDRRILNEVVRGFLAERMNGIHSKD